MTSIVCKFTTKHMLIQSKLTYPRRTSRCENGSYAIGREQSSLLFEQRDGRLSLNFGRIQSNFLGGYLSQSSFLLPEFNHTLFNFKRGLKPEWKMNSYEMSSYMNTITVTLAQKTVGNDRKFPMGKLPHRTYNYKRTKHIK